MGGEQRIAKMDLHCLVRPDCPNISGKYEKKIVLFCFFSLFCLFHHHLWENNLSIAYSCIMSLYLLFQIKFMFCLWKRTRENKTWALVYWDSSFDSNAIFRAAYAPLSTGLSGARSFKNTRMGTIVSRKISTARFFQDAWVGSTIWRKISGARFFQDTG